MFDTYRDSVDLLATSVLTAGALLATVGAPLVAIPSVVRVLVGLPFLLFAPGYVLSVAVFPRSTTEATNDGASGLADVNGEALGGVERLVISCASSLIALAVVAFVSDATLWAIQPVPIVLGLGALTAVATAVALLRRQSVPSRFRPDPAGALNAIFGVKQHRDLVFVVALVVAVTVSAVGVVYASSVEQSSEQFSEYALLSETESGKLTATDHPSELPRDEPTTLHTYIENHQGHQVTYTVIVTLERVGSPNGDGTESRELARLTPTLSAGESRSVQHTVSPTMTGEDLRLKYLFYSGEPPTDPSQPNSDDSLHLWVDVVPAG